MTEHIPLIYDGIATVGFPIVAFLLMYYQSSKTIKENTNTLRKVCEEIQNCRKR